MNAPAQSRLGALQGGDNYAHRFSIGAPYVPQMST